MSDPQGLLHFCSHHFQLKQPLLDRTVCKGKREKQKDERKEVISRIKDKRGKALFYNSAVSIHCLNNIYIISQSHFKTV